jgi:hypothetical protein
MRMPAQRVVVAPFTELRNVQLQTTVQSSSNDHAASVSLAT